MKKFLLFFSLIIITACSSGDDDKPKQDNITGDQFNPPAWITGSWKQDNTSATYTFTNDDILVTVGGSRLSFKDQAAQLREAKVVYSILETKTDNSYTAEFKTPAGTTIFSFTKAADNSITSNGYLGGAYIKQ